jgi:hypothetical protein
MIGRDGEIRTRDPLHPMQVRYQAAPRPDTGKIDHPRWGTAGGESYLSRRRYQK